MSCCASYLIRALISLAIVHLAVLQDFKDPTPQELALVEWASGINIAACGDGIFDNITTLFRIAFSEVLNKYCHNITACYLQKNVIFTPGDIMLLEGYPRREYNGVRLRFVVILPTDALPQSDQKHPLLSREVIFNVFSQSQNEIENRMQMYILDYERFPRFDPLTEFMNIAVIPIGFCLMVIMFGLAYWTSTLTSSRNSGGSWFGGNCREKSYAERRSLSLSIANNQEFEDGLRGVKVIEDPERKRKIRFTFEKKQQCGQADEYDCETSSRQLMRQDALSSYGQPFHSDSMEGSTHEGDTNDTSNLTSRNTASGSNKQRLAGFTRRLSSFEEVFKERKRRKTRRNGGGSKRDVNNRWKSTSMALGGFRPTK